MHVSLIYVRLATAFTAFNEPRYFEGRIRQKHSAPVVVYRRPTFANRTQGVRRWTWDRSNKLFHASSECLLFTHTIASCFFPACFFVVRLRPPSGSPSTEDDIRFATFMLQEILRSSRRKWAAEVNLVAFSALSSLTYVYKHLDSSRLEIARGIVITLAEIIVDLINKPVNEWEREDNDRLLQRALITMTDWFMVDPEFTASIDHASYAVLLRSIVTALGGLTALNARAATPAPSIKAAALFALNNLLYRAANFPTQSGPHRVSSEICEEDVLQQISADPEVARQHARYFALDGSIILTLIDVPNPGGSTYGSNASRLSRVLSAFTDPGRLRLCRALRRTNCSRLYWATRMEQQAASLRGHRCGAAQPADRPRSEQRARGSTAPRSRPI